MLSTLSNILRILFVICQFSFFDIIDIANAKCAKWYKRPVENDEETTGVAYTLSDL